MSESHTEMPNTSRVISPPMKSFNFGAVNLWPALVSFLVAAVVGATSSFGILGLFAWFFYLIPSLAVSGIFYAIFGRKFQGLRSRILKFATLSCIWILSFAVELFVQNFLVSLGERSTASSNATQQQNWLNFFLISAFFPLMYIVVTGIMFLKEVVQARRGPKLTVQKDQL